MGRPYSIDLRERVVSAVEKSGMSRRQAAAQFGVGVSTAIAWVRLFRKTGSVAPGKMGGHKPKAIAGAHRIWLLQRIDGKDFTIRGLVAEFAERGLKVDYRSVWNFLHAEKLSFKKKLSSPASAIAPTSRTSERSGKSIRAGSSLSVWPSSMRPGPRRTWRRCEVGRPEDRGCRRKHRSDTGTR